jgi:hypothetical protein
MHVVAIDHEDVACAVEWPADGVDGEAAAIKRAGWVSFI